MHSSSKGRTHNIVTLWKEKMVPGCPFFRELLHMTVDCVCVYSDRDLLWWQWWGQMTLSRWVVASSAHTLAEMRERERERFYSVKTVSFAPYLCHLYQLARHQHDLKTQQKTEHSLIPRPLFPRAAIPRCCGTTTFSKSPRLYVGEVPGLLCT